MKDTVLPHLDISNDVLTDFDKIFSPQSLPSMTGLGGLLPSSNALALHAHGSTDTTGVMDNILQLKSILMKGKIQNDFCFGDCDINGLQNRKINGTLELSLSNECNGVRATCNAGTVTVGSSLYVLMKSINQDVADFASGVSLNKLICIQVNVTFS